MAIKYIDPYHTSKTQALILTTIGMIVFFGVPSLLFCIIGTFTAYMSRSNPHDLPDFLTYTFLLCLVIGFFGYLYINQRRNINGILKSIKETGYFKPLPTDEVIKYLNGNYIGLDTKNGILVYIAHVGTNRLFSRSVLVWGFDTKNWRSMELSGNELKIFTGEPDIPYIAFSHHKMPHLYAKFNALRGKYFDHDNLSIPGYIEHKAINATEKLGLDLILPRK